MLLLVERLDVLGVLKDEGPKGVLGEANPEDPLDGSGALVVRGVRPARARPSP